MLYQIYETQRAWISPFSEFASAASKLYSHPLSPMAHLPIAQRVAAGFDLVHRLTKEYEKPEFDINKVNVHGTDVVIQEQVVEAKPFCRLLRFKRFTDDGKLLDKLRAQPSVLVVAPQGAATPAATGPAVPTAPAGGWTCATPSFTDQASNPGVSIRSLTAIARS